jgi:hypothetical protein
LPSRRAELHPSTDGGRATSSLTGTRQKIIVGVDRIKNRVQLILTYGKPISVEFPNNALKLYCNANGSQRILSLSDTQKEGDQISKGDSAESDISNY